MFLKSKLKIYIHLPFVLLHESTSLSRFQFFLVKEHLESFDSIRQEDIDKSGAIREPSFHSAIDMALLRKRFETADSKRVYWKAMAEEKILDVEIKKKKKEDIEKSIELKDATIAHIKHKDDILRQKHGSFQ